MAGEPDPLITKSVVSRIYGYRAIDLQFVWLLPPDANTHPRGQGMATKPAFILPRRIAQHEVTSEEPLSPGLSLGIPLAISHWLWGQPFRALLWGIHTVNEAGRRPANVIPCRLIPFCSLPIQGNAVTCLLVHQVRIISDKGGTGAYPGYGIPQVVPLTSINKKRVIRNKVFLGVVVVGKAGIGPGNRAHPGEGRTGIPPEGSPTITPVVEVLIIEGYRLAGY
ncbi:hypothetical protein ES703_97390 [subsurface metagenome]